ncbi:MAG: glycosyltransferase family 4 protein [Verrucomicrobiia bacterium]
MRVLLLNQFYLPDVAPTGVYLHDLARVLVLRGNQVTMICSRRSYDGTKIFPRSEILDGVEVARLPATGFGRRGFTGKLADYASFYGSLLAALLLTRRRPDLILSLTTPPYIGLLAKLAAKRHRCRHAHWIMDLYPDVMSAHGMARNGMLIRILQKLTRFQFKGADPVIALGPTMADCVARYMQDHATASTQSNGTTDTGSDNRRTVDYRQRTSDDQPLTSEPAAFNGQASTVHWFPLWSNSELLPWPDNEPNPLRAKRQWTPDQVVFLYSGNMGLGHRFGEFLEAARRLGISGPRWVFAGDGKRREEVEAVAKSIPKSRIDFLGYVPHDTLRAHLCAADVHLVSLDSAWQGFMVPSKLQGSFAVGRPVIYVGGRKCEIAVWIQESGGGWVIDENDVEGLLKAIQQALDPGERRKRSNAALQFARKHFNLLANCARIAQLLEGNIAVPQPFSLAGRETFAGQAKAKQ